MIEKNTTIKQYEPFKKGGEIMYSGRVCSACSTGGILHVNLVSNQVISHEWGKDRIVIMTLMQHVHGYKGYICGTRVLIYITNYLVQSSLLVIDID